MTTVRLFAALKAAADDAASIEVAATTPVALTAELVERFGPVMARRLSVATLFVDGSTVPLDDERDLTGADEVVLVPPFSGGA